MIWVCLFGALLFGGLAWVWSKATASAKAVTKEAQDDAARKAAEAEALAKYEEQRNAIAEAADAERRKVVGLDDAARAAEADRLLHGGPLQGPPSSPAT